MKKKFTIFIVRHENFLISKKTVEAFAYNL